MLPSKFIHLLEFDALFSFSLFCLFFFLPSHMTTDWSFSKHFLQPKHLHEDLVISLSFRSYKVWEYSNLLQFWFKLQIWISSLENQIGHEMFDKWDKIGQLTAIFPTLLLINFFWITEGLESELHVKCS